jgi:glycosyltransferase involved in cell wall biosynthesis
MDQKKLTICYFGIFDPNFSRNKVYIRGLRENGVEVIECIDRSRSLLKFWKLYKKHKKIKDAYDILVVGYPGYIIAPFAKFITKKPIVLDALCSFYEAQILSRDAYRGVPMRTFYTRFVDWFANRSADYILLETDAQKNYYTSELKVPEDKCIVVRTGVDDASFYFDSEIKKHDTFTVLFRGRLMSEAGVKYIVEAAKILEGRGVNFEIIGFGWGETVRALKTMIDEYKLSNLELTFSNLPVSELRERMLRCHVSLGQFEAHERLKRTIPHKAYEAMVMRLPYITAEAPAIMELFRDGENCLFVAPASPEDLVEKILKLKNNPGLRELLSGQGYRHYINELTPKKIVAELLRDLGERIGC